MQHIVSFAFDGETACYTMTARVHHADSSVGAPREIEVVEALCLETGATVDPGELAELEALEMGYSGDLAPAAMDAIYAGWELAARHAAGRWRA